MKRWICAGLVSLAVVAVVGGRAEGNSAASTPAWSDVQAELIAAAQDLPTSGKLKVDGTETTPVCSRIYDRFNDSNPTAAYPNPDCNYVYVSASRKYWKTLSPILVNAYGDSLGLQTDENSNGPHITVDETCCGAVVFGSSSDPLKLPLNSKGKLDATGLRETLKSLLDSSSESNFVASDEGLGEPIVGAPFKVRCRQAWVGSQRRRLKRVAVEKGSFFTCNAHAHPGGRLEGNIYPTVNLLGDPNSDGTVDAYVDVWEAYQEDLPRRDPSGGYGIDNVILPVQMPEASSQPKVSWDLPPVGSDCSTATICPQLWVVDNLEFDYDKGTYETDPKQPCVIWGVLEVQSDAISGTGGFMDKYGLPTDGFNAHVSLAQSYGDAAQCALAEQIAGGSSSSTLAARAASDPADPGQRMYRVLRARQDVDSNITLGVHADDSCGGRMVTRLGTAETDALKGTSGDDVFIARGGADRIRGGGGEDRICAGSGADRVQGGSGRDLLRGEGGNDVLRGGGSRDLLLGGPGRDRCPAAGRDRVRSCRR